jgi:hypothetical protein
MYQGHYLIIEGISGSHFTATFLHSMFQQLLCDLTLLLGIGHPAILPTLILMLKKVEMRIRHGQRRSRIHQLAGGVVLLLSYRQLQQPQRFRRRRRCARVVPLQVLRRSRGHSETRPHHSDRGFRTKRGSTGRARVWGTCLEGGRWGSDAELRAPLAKHLVNLLFEHGGAALLARRLQAGEHLLQVVDARLGAVAELPVPRRRAGALAARGGVVGVGVGAGGWISRHLA